MGHRHKILILVLPESRGTTKFAVSFCEFCCPFYLQTMEVNRMRTIQDELIRSKLSKKTKPKKRKRKKKPQVNYSTREIEELMGKYKQTYTRRHGAIRSK